MKKVLGVVLAAIVAVGVNAAFAGEGCCASKAKAKAAASATCSDMYSKLNLTDAQKTKLSALEERTKRATSTSEGRDVFQKGLAEILTPEQMAQCKANCEKDKASGSCPMMSTKAEKKS